jgi:16S rRNA (guanine527-N7)-methyltransferase
VTSPEDDPRLRRWVERLLAAPGLTAVREPREAWRVHVEDALYALPYVTHGPVVDVGSGGGSPGFPLAVARPELHVVLLESSRRKCAFLEEAAREFPNAEVVCARAEEHGRGSGRDAYAAALARALAPPAVAAEWCLPLVRPGGACVLYAGAGAGDLRPVARALAAAPPEIVPVGESGNRWLIVLRKLGPTPDRFPRRPGIARKRPLA